MASLALPPPPPERVEQLVQFYKIHDVTLMEEATLILSEHAFEEVAEALRARYGMLPPGWRATVGAARGSKTVPGSLAPLKAAMAMSPKRKVLSPKGSAEKFDFHELGGDDHSKQQLSPKASGAKTLSPKGSMEKFDFHDLSAAASSVELEESSDGYMGNMVVNEICDTERAFLDKMTFLREKYVDALYDVLAGKGGKEAAASLGIDVEQANQVFQPLGNVVRFSRALLDKLEVISLVRSRPRSGRARAYFVAEAFLAMAPKLHAYAPIITTYKSNLEVISEASKNAKSGSKYLNFLEWWDQIAATSELLRGHALQSVLIMPMQRIPRYEMLLKELLKKCSDETAKPLIEQALEGFATAAKEINEAVRTHEKVSKFFGAGAELKPVRATTTVGKDGVAKIHNEYAVALPKKFTE